MDPVSRDLDRQNIDPRPDMAPTADLETRLGAMQVGGEGDMLLDDYDTVGEKQDVAIITPDESIDEPINPLAYDCTLHPLTRQVRAD